MKKHLDIGRGVFCHDGPNGNETSRIEDATCLDCLVCINKIVNRRYDELWGEIDRLQGDLFAKRLPQKPVDLRQGSEGDGELDKAQAPVVSGACRICGGVGYIKTPIMGELAEGTKQTLCWHCGSTGREDG